MLTMSYGDQKHCKDLHNINYLLKKLNIPIVNNDNVIRKREGAECLSLHWQSVHSIYEITRRY